jgi:FKBP-type peptidyl-prolyl cis-trans isomerase FkpA
MFKKTRIWFSLIIITFIVLGTSCNPAKKYEEEERQRIQDYIAAHPEINFDLKKSGLYYADVVVGTGMPAATHDTAYVMYLGTLLDGTVFDKNEGTADTAIFPINEGFVPIGFDEGLTYMNEGGTAIFLIPSYLAFGQYNYYFPSYTPVIYTTRLVKIVPSGAKK